MNEKKEVLWWADSPTVATGFGTVSRNLLKVLHETGKYRFTVLGISYMGVPYDIEKFPYLKFPEQGGLFPAAEGQDIYGFSRVLKTLQTGIFDVLFILNDPFVIAACLSHILRVRDEAKKKFKIVFYFPTDVPPKKEWVSEVIAKVDFPVAYTDYGVREIAKHMAPDSAPFGRIYHGTDKSIFFPIVGEARAMLRKALFGTVAEHFIILNVNRNQPRKDLNRTFEVFAKVHKKIPETFLYILAATNDVGGNLIEIAEQHGLVYGKDWGAPPVGLYNPNQGVPVETVNQIYNCADLVMTTTLGEGWGLSITEAMACKVPVIAPRHTSLQEIVGENEERGFLVKCGGPDHTVSLGAQDNNRVRPAVHVDEMAEDIIKIIRYPSKTQKKIAAAAAWVPSWDDVGASWREIFELATKQEEPENP